MLWVLKNEQEAPDAEAGGQNGGAPSCSVTYYQPSPRLWWFVSAFPLQMTDSATKDSSCLSGAIPGARAPTPCCRGCGALIKETAEARDPGQRGQENQKATVRNRGRGLPERSRLQSRREPGQGTGTNLALFACFRASPCPPLPREVLLYQGPFGWCLHCDSINSANMSRWHPLELIPLLCSLSRPTCCS